MVVGMMIAIEVLENGRVGQVRVESSSGYERLDDAAVRQAKRWRLKPGMRDGVNRMLATLRRRSASPRHDARAGTRSCA